MFLRKCRVFPIIVVSSLRRQDIKVSLSAESEQFIFNSARMGKLKFPPIYFLVISCLSILSCVNAQCAFEPDGVSKFVTNQKTDYLVTLHRHSYLTHGPAPVTFGAGEEESSTENAIQERSSIRSIVIV